MRTIFEILSPSADAENCILLCEVSNEGFSYVIRDEVQNSIAGLAIYQYDKTTPPVGFPIALQILFHGQPRLSENFKKTIINYSLPESVLIPFSLYNRQQNEDVLNLIHGDLYSNNKILTDVLTKHSLYNIFRVPAAVYDVIQTQFPNAGSAHQYSVLLNQEASENNELSAIFYSQKIIISVIKDGKCQLINTFNYRTPEDVTYILLTLCRQHDLKNKHLRISGLIEQNSALYKEIYKYFDSIELSPLQENINYTEEIIAFPSHYFSHIFAIDSCG